MAKICQICEKKISFLEEKYVTQNLLIHTKCRQTFANDPKKYGAVPEKLTAIEKRYITKATKDKTPSQEEMPVRVDNNKEIVITSIDISFDNAFNLTAKFFFASLVFLFLLALLGLIFAALFGYLQG